MEALSIGLLTCSVLAVWVAFLTLPKWFNVSMCRRKMWQLRDEAHAHYRNTGDIAFRDVVSLVEASIRVADQVTFAQAGIHFMLVRNGFRPPRAPSVVSPEDSNVELVRELLCRHENLRTWTIFVSSWLGLIIGAAPVGILLLIDRLRRCPPTHSAYEEKIVGSAGRAAAAAERSARPKSSKLPLPV